MIYLRYYRLVFSFSLLLSVMSAAGQPQAGQSYYVVRTGDDIIKHLCSYVQFDDDSESAVWDIGNLDITDEKFGVAYTAAFGRSGIVAGTEFNTRFYYEQRQDSLMLWGYENNLMKVDYDRPEFLLRTPLVYGQSHDGLFHGTMEYCESMFMRVFGSYHVEVDGTGVLVLPSGDTLRHVSRVHLTECTLMCHYPQMTTSRELAAYVDRVVYTSDSIRTAMAKGPVQVKHTYRWYAAGYRYPILESVALETEDDRIQGIVSYYCPPEEQRLLEDEENAKLRDVLAETERRTRSSGNSPSPLSNLNININSNMVTLDYDLTQDATLNALVCNTQGMVFIQQTQTHVVGTGYRMTLNCSTLRSGEYVLYLNANGYVQNIKVSISR